jgi:hypothetical protein
MTQPFVQSIVSCFVVNMPFMAVSSNELHISSIQPQSVSTDSQRSVTPQSVDTPSVNPGTSASPQDIGDTGSTPPPASDE